MRENVINPFVIGKYVSPEYFCDRTNETALLKKHLQNGRNMTLISDRRLGKSGLISHLFVQDDIRRAYYTVYVDLFATSSLDELVCAFGNAVYSTVSAHVTWKEKFFQIISSLRFGFKLDEVTGTPTFNVGIGEIANPQLTLEQIFAFLEAADRVCVVAFDEFQQVALYDQKNIEALLRTHIQQCKNTQFIFAGSRKHMMAQMFLSPSKPFYQSTVNMSLEPIPEQTYITFAQDMFAKSNKSIGSSLVERIYSMCRGITWYMQVMLNEMFALTPDGEACADETIELAMTNVIQIQELFYRELLASTPARQRQLLYAIARERVAHNLTSEGFVRKHHLASASSVQSALRSLRDKDIVTQIGDGYAVYDVFLEQFIQMS